jgi:23S rRNA pseudouridine1911/1915/1917 synthase
MDPSLLQVLYEDNHIIAVNKKPSDIVQGDKTGDPTLADRVRDYIRLKYGKTGNVYIGIPHRLDRPTSGVVLFARTEKALQRLSELFRQGDVAKTYWAIVAEKPPRDADTLVHWLRRDPVKNKSFVVAGPRADAREARLSYRLVFSLERYHLLSIELHTGRHHQIRAQLHAIGCHVKGDLKYGAPRSNPGGGIHLHARQVSFIHPVKNKPLTIIADPPADTLWDAARERWNQESGAPGS